MNVYSVRYRRSVLSPRTYRVTVRALDADEARAKAAIRDPELLSTVAVKNRGPVAGGSFELPTCFICHKPVHDELWTNVDFGPSTGIQTICDVCWERAS